MSRRYPCPMLPGPGERIRLDSRTSHHLLRVCVLPRGRTLVLFDGQGNEVEARLVGTEAGIAIVEGLEASDPSTIPIAQGAWLLVAMAKGEVFPRVLRMATELGGSVIVPILTLRSVARAEHPERWLRILEAAAAQSGRVTLPRLLPLMPLEEALVLPGLPSRRLVLLPGNATPPEPSEAPALLVGPEGGLDPTEVESAITHGFEPAGLGPWTLRVDTAVASGLARYGRAELRAPRG